MYGLVKSGKKSAINSAAQRKFALLPPSEKSNNAPNEAQTPQKRSLCAISKTPSVRECATAAAKSNTIEKKAKYLRATKYAFHNADTIILANTPSKFFAVSRPIFLCFCRGGLVPRIGISEIAVRNQPKNHFRAPSQKTF
jgi:hypothetical protein